MISKLTGRFQFIEGWENAYIIRFEDGTLGIVETRLGDILDPDELLAIRDYLQIVRDSAKNL